MKIKSQNHLYLVFRSYPKECRQCKKEIKKKELCYGKRKRHVYCAECAFILGFIKGDS